MTWDAYHSFDDFDSYLDYLVEKYESFVSVETIGMTYEKRIMRVLKVCKGECSNNSKPAIWIDGGIHAREWISPATVSFLIRELVEKSDDHKDLIEQLNWYFLPVMNPDGYVYTFSDERFWRKNRYGC